MVGVQTIIADTNGLSTVRFNIAEEVIQASAQVI